jgi:hypothetical protein
VYPWQLQADQLEERGASSVLTLLNPVTSVVITLQRAIYGADSFVGGDGKTTFILPDEGPLWYLRNLGVVGLVAAGIFVLAVHVFGRLEANFAETL